MSDNKMPVSQRAAVARVRRRLAEDRKLFFKVRGDGFVVVDAETGTVEERNVDLCEIARRLGLIRNFEKVEPPG